MWATQVAGGDEPPSVLSDNLQGLALKVRPFLVSGGLAADSRTNCSKVTNWYRKVLRSQDGSLYGGKRLVSVSLSNGRGR